VDSGEIEFSKSVNLLVGQNNSGKSTILRSLYLLQPADPGGNYVGDFSAKYRRRGVGEMEIALKVAEAKQEHFVLAEVKQKGFSSDQTIRFCDTPHSGFIGL